MIQDETVPSCRLCCLDQRWSACGYRRGRKTTRCCKKQHHLSQRFFIAWSTQPSLHQLPGMTQEEQCQRSRNKHKPVNMAQSRWDVYGNLVRRQGRVGPGQLGKCYSMISRRKYSNELQQQQYRSRGRFFSILVGKKNTISKSNQKQAASAPRIPLQEIQVEYSQTSQRTSASTPPNNHATSMAQFLGSKGMNIQTEGQRQPGQIDLQFESIFDNLKITDE